MLFSVCKCVFRQTTFSCNNDFCHLKDAKKDESVRKSYKYLAALHEVCQHVCLTLLYFITSVAVIREHATCHLSILDSLIEL